MWQSLKSIMPGAIKKAGIHEQITAQRVLFAAEKMLQARWGDEKARFVTFTKFSNGVLIAASRSATAMQILNVEKAELMNSINHNLGQRAVKEIRVRN